MKVAPTVLAGGKGGDNVKPLPICHEYRAGIFCGEVEVVLSNSNYGIEFLKLFEHDGIHKIRFVNIP
jgi:hypothetical protein